MILLIDNYDSFSYNLYQLVGSINPDIRVIRNDAMRVGEIAALKPEAIIISPGPGRPEDAGICMDVIRDLGGTIPMLGVCLGHQAMCATYGATVSYANQLMHGKQSNTLTVRSFAAVRRRFSSRVIIPSRRWREPCRSVSASPRGRWTARSWRLCTKHIPYLDYNFIPNQY